MPQPPPLRVAVLGCLGLSLQNRPTHERARFSAVEVGVGLVVVGWLTLRSDRCRLKSYQPSLAGGYNLGFGEELEDGGSEEEPGSPLRVNE